MSIKSFFTSKKKELKREVTTLKTANTDLENKLAAALLAAKAALEEKGKLASQLDAHRKVLSILPYLSMTDKKSEDALRGALANLINEVPQKTVYLNDRGALNKTFWEAVDPLYQAKLLKMHTVEGDPNGGADVDLKVFSEPLKTPEAALAVLRGVSEEMAELKIYTSIKIRREQNGISLEFSHNGYGATGKRMVALVEAANLLGMEAEIKSSSVRLLIPQVA